MDSAPLFFVLSYICLIIFYSLTFNFCLSSLFVFYSNQLRLVPTLLCVLPLVEVRTATFRFLRLSIRDLVLCLIFLFCYSRVFVCASKVWFTSALVTQGGGSFVSQNTSSQLQTGCASSWPCWHCAPPSSWTLRCTTCCRCPWWDCWAHILCVYLVCLFVAVYMGLVLWLWSSVYSNALPSRVCVST